MYVHAWNTRQPDTSATRHFGTNFKPNHRWICVLSELSLVQSVPTFRRSDAEVSRTAFLVQKCLETVLKCLMRVRSVLWPKCPVTGHTQESYSCLSSCTDSRCLSGPSVRVPVSSWCSWRRRSVRSRGSCERTTNTSRGRCEPETCRRERFQLEWTRSVSTRRPFPRSRPSVANPLWNTVHKRIA